MLRVAVDLLLHRLQAGLLARKTSSARRSGSARRGGHPAARAGRGSPRAANRRCPAACRSPAPARGVGSGRREEKRRANETVSGQRVFLAPRENANAIDRRTRAGENDNGETSRAGGARRVSYLASPRRRRARPAGARAPTSARHARRPGAGLLARCGATTRDRPLLDGSSERPGFQKPRADYLVGSVVSPTRRTCSNDTVCCICASFSRLLWNIVGRSERAPRGEHSGAPADARQRAIRRQEKKPRQLARGSVSRPAQLTRRLGKKTTNASRTEREQQSGELSRKKSFQNYITCGSMFSRPSRFAAAQRSASESDFTLARSRPRGWRVRARRAVVATSARGSDADRAPSRGTSPALAHTDHSDCGHDAGSRVGDARVRARTPLPQNAHRGRLRVEDARLGARSRDARGARRAPALEPRRTSSARALREVWSGTTRRTERRTTTTPPNARRPDTLRTTTLRMANEERTRKKFCWSVESKASVLTTMTKRETRLNVLERLPTRTGWTMIGSGVRRVSSGCAVASIDAAQNPERGVVSGGF